MAIEVGSAFVRFFVKDEVSGEVDKVESSTKKAAGSMDSAAQSAGTKLKNGFDKAKSGAATCAKGLAVLGAGATALVGGMFALAGASQEYTEDMGKLTTAFGTARDAQGELKWSTEDAKGVYQDFVGILGETDQAVEASNHLAALATSQQDLNKWGTIAAGVYARFGDSLPLEGLTEAANETAKVGQVTGPLADALNWAGVQEDAFNESLAACNDEQERSQLITDTLNGIYQEAGQTYQETNGDLIAARQAQSDWNEKVAEAGQAVQPMTTALQTMATELLEKAMPYLQEFATWVQENMPAVQQYFQDAATKFGEAWQEVQPVVQPILDAIKDFFDWVIQNLPQIAPIVAGVIAGIIGFQAVVGIISAVSGVFTALSSAITLVKGAFELLKLAFATNPLGMIITIIGILVGVFITLWTTNEDFRNAVMGIWDAISSKASEIFGAIGQFISDVWNNISTAASDTWNGIKSTVENVVNNIRDTVRNVFDSVKSKVEGVWNGIKDTISNAINSAKGVVDSAIGTIKNLMNFSWSLPPLKLPHFSINGEFSLNPPSIPTIGISWYAKGGIFDKATILPTASGLAGVGEAGAEAVAPIDTLMGYVQKAVADVVGGKGGTYAPVTNVYTGETSEQKLAKLIERNEKRTARSLGIV